MEASNAARAPPLASRTRISHRPADIEADANQQRDGRVVNRLVLRSMIWARVRALQVMGAIRAWMIKMGIAARYLSPKMSGMRNGPQHRHPDGNRVTQTGQ